MSRLLRFLFILCGAIIVAMPARAESVAANGTTIYYESRGKGEPLILLEGGNLDLRQWDEQFKAFSKTYRVIRYDVRGFGRSGAVGAPYRALDDLAGLLDALKIERAHLVGLSLGGRIAIDFALVHPARVASLVLAGPGLSGFDWSQGDIEWYRPIAKASERGDSLAAADLWLESPYLSPAMENPKLAKHLRKLARANSRVWVHRDKEEQLDPPAAGRLGEIKAPVLILIGTRDVNDIHRIVEALEKDIPHAKKIVFENTGHMLNLERPDDFNRAVLLFVGSL